MSIPGLNISEPSATTVPRRSDWEIREALSLELRGWWSKERADWDTQVEGSPTAGMSEATDSDLWGSMPVVDSKTVARTSPVFEKHLGRPLDIRLIRPRGYESVDHMIGHLIPLMMSVPHARSRVRAVKQEVES